MIQLLKTEEAIRAALAGVLFDVPDSEARDLLFYQGELPEKRRNDHAADDVAFCLLEPGGFRLGRVAVMQQVRATFVLYEAHTRADGLAMVADTIGRLQKLPQTIYTPCSLQGDIEGDHQAIEHPYYRFTLTFTLTTAGGGM